MNDTNTINGALLSAINAAHQAGVSAADFVIQQAPDVCSQVVTYAAISGVIKIMIGSMLLALAVQQFLAMKRLKQGPSVALVASIMVGLVILPSGLFGTVKAVFAPKLVIMEKISSLTR